MSERQSVVLDTNVIIDAFVRAKDARSRSSVELLRRIEKGWFIGVLPAPVLVEVYYIVLDFTHDPVRARKVLSNLLALPNMTTRSIRKEDALQAIEYYQRLNYFRLGSGDKLGKRDEGLSTVDAIILAVGRSIPGAVVCSNESKFTSLKDVKVKKPWELVDIFQEKVV
jgi:predicted nucleic acid-binding protein